MLLAADLGNTETTLGLFRGEQLVAHWRLTTVRSRTPDEWMAAVTSHLVQAGHSTDEVRAAVLASVAPMVTGAFSDGLAKATGAHPMSVGPDSQLPVVLDVDEPMTVGADRVVNTLAAVDLYHRDTIVVDFGTATTFDCVTADGRFIGGVIAPGLQTAAEYLTQQTAKLPATELYPPENVIGKRTEDCVRSGVLYGAVDGADGMVRRIKAEWPGGAEPRCVATGGLAQQVAALSVEIEAVEPHLTLFGLRIAAGHLGLEW